MIPVNHHQCYTNTLFGRIQLRRCQACDARVCCQDLQRASVKHVSRVCPLCMPLCLATYESTHTHTQHIKVTGTAGPSAVPGISCPKSSLCNFGMSSDFGQLHSARRCLCLLPGMRQRASAKWKDLDLCHSLFGRQLHHDLNNQYRWLH